MFTLIAKLLNVLNSDSEPKHIALAIALAMLAGFNSIMSVFGIFILLLLLIIRANLTVFIAMLAVFSGLKLLLITIISDFGSYLLQLPSLTSQWTEFYQTSWFRFSELYNSAVMGQLVSSIILIVPVYALSYWLIVKYRLAMKHFVERFKIVQSLKASKFYQIYLSVQSA